MSDAAKFMAKLWIPRFLVFLLLSSDLLQAQLIDVDFNQNNGPGWGGGGPNPGPTMSGAAVLGAAGDRWNGINVNTGSGLALIYATGSASPVTMSFTSAGGYDAYSYSGTSPFTNTAFNSLMTDYLYAGSPQAITISGLAPNSAYKLVLYNAADKNAAGRTTYFTVNGSTLTSTWDAASSTLVNGVDYVEFNCALSDALGNLTVTYNGNGTVEGDVDGFQIQAAPMSMNAAQNGTNLLLSFSTQAGLNYQLVYKTNLLSAAWSMLGSPVYGSNAIQSVSDVANAHSSRFYRLLVATNVPAAVSLLHASGTNIVNAGGDVVLLKGLNLGGWFIMEKWMCPLDVDANLPDTYSVITNLDSRFGVATEQSLIHGYQTNWITLADLNNITNGGFNCVRMPVWWGNFYSINNTTSTGWRADAFSVLDWLVTNCATRGIYVVIDMHGVVGGQGTSDDTGWENQNQYWTNSVDQSETTYMWTQITAHYKGNPAVAGFDLINEPDGTTSTGDVWPAYTNLYTAIRAVDPSRMLIMEGTFGNWDWSMLPNPTTYHWTNIVYSMHIYDWGGDAAQVEAGSDGSVSDFDSHLSWNVPSYVGEWNDLGQGAAAYEYSVNDYTTSGQSWTMWAYKATDGLVPDGWGWYDPTYWSTTPNISTDSAATIANDWTQWRTTTSFGTNAAVGL